MKKQINFAIRKVKLRIKVLTKQVIEIEKSIPTQLSESIKEMKMIELYHYKVILESLQNA